MSKSKWLKHKESGEVFYMEGYTQSGAVVLRDRGRKLKWVSITDFRNWYDPTNTSGFPPLKPKFKPRYAVYDGWSCDEAFVKEYEPGKFKVVLKDGQEISRDTTAWRHFAAFFKDGSWEIVSEDEAMARLDKPKAPIPSTGQFGPGPWYGGGLVYRQATFQDGYGFYAFNYKTTEHVGWVSYKVVQHLWDLNMVSRERPRAVEPAKQAFNPLKELKDTIDSSPKLQADLAKMATIRPKDAKPKKVLVEWAIRLKATPNESYYTRLFPEGATPALSGQKYFKTGRTVEVPQ